MNLTRSSDRSGKLAIRLGEWVFFFSINVNAACDSVPISNEEIFTFLFAFVNSNLEKEISFDFGPSGEFAYLYSQCYDLTTSEYVCNRT